MDPNTDWTERLSWFGSIVFAVLNVAASIVVLGLLAALAVVSLSRKLGF